MGGYKARPLRQSETLSACLRVDPRFRGGDIIGFRGRLRIQSFPRKREFTPPFHSVSRQFFPNLRREE